MIRYTVPKPTEAILISGGLTKRPVETPYKISTGQGVFSFWFIHKVHRFHTGANTVNIAVSAQSAQNVEVQVEASVVFSVGQDTTSITKAANRFLDTDYDQVIKTAHDIFSGETRAIIGTLTVENMISDRLSLASEVLTNAAPKMTNFGWIIDSFQINSISDNSGYINSLSAPELSRVRKEEEIAKARTESLIEEERQKTEREKSEYQRDTDLKTSENIKAAAQARVEAANAEELARVEVDKDLALRHGELKIIEADTKAKTAESEARLVAAQAEVEKKEQELKKMIAEAEAERVIIAGKAESEKQLMLSKAITKEFLDEKLVESMPEIVSSLGVSLEKADMTIVGGEGSMSSLIENIAVLAPMVRKTLNDNIIANTDNES